MAINHIIFGWIDYTIFGGLLGISLFIGVYFGFFSKQNSVSEYLFGGKSVHYLPIATSILASFVSGITLVGVPTEVYLHGSQYSASVICACFTGLVSAYITVPTFYKLRVSSTFEYLEIRFSKNIRKLTSLLYIISISLILPVIVYVPSLAFSLVSDFNIHTITLILSIICIVYTSMGGVKAVIWTDTIQFLFTIGGLLSVLIIGTIKVGGVSEIWRIAQEGQRIKFFNMDPSPFKRDTFWAITIGLTFVNISYISTGQKYMQRLLSISKEADTKKAVALIMTFWTLINIGSVFVGLLMYAQYHSCDPLKADLIKRSDQTLPYYIMDIAGNIPGLPGMFFAGLVSSSLSTMSAGMNTLSGLIYQNYIDQWIPRNSKKDARAANIMKAITVLIGCVTIGLIFVIKHLGTVFEITYSMLGTINGTLLGLFLAGMLLPWIGKTGAITGAYSSLIIMACINGGQQWYIFKKRIRHPSLPTSIEDCPYTLNETLLQESSSPLPPIAVEDEPMFLFRIVNLYFVLIGTIIVILVSSITSYFVGETDLSKVNPDHLSPIVQRLLRKKLYIEVPLEDLKLESTLTNKQERNKI